MSEPNAPGQSQHGKDNERKVTDPVTHLPLLIHDANSIELERIPPPPSENEERKVDAENGNGDGVALTNHQHINMERALFKATHQGWWANPSGDRNKLKIRTSMAIAMSACLGAFGSLLFWPLLSSHTLGTFGFMALVIPVCCCILGISIGTNAHTLSFFNADRQQPSNVLTEHSDEKPQDNKGDAPESAAWLNSIIKSLWPVVNPALFTSVSDMLEDALQASLPKLVHAVRVADIGQGMVPMRILAIRWLDAGSAAEAKDGMKAEDGDFVNMEIAFAYRAKTVSGNGLKERSGNAHVFLEFYVAGGVMFPVWVELTGFLATARARIQLTPNPPFFSVMTMTFLGQPMIKLDCTPLAKDFLNIMDVPGLSGWLQKSINTAIAEYVAPRSLHVDLKTILMGTEKMDTDAVGIIVVTVKSAQGFKPGDSSKLKSDEAKNGDPYVTIGWGKWGKPVWSTRVIPKGGHPVWEETTALLVGPTEINSHEALQLQLWDSDRWTADDLLGRVEIPLQELMKNDRTYNKISTHEDDLRDINGKPCPGKLYWECGYFAKTTLEQHLARKQQDAKEIEATIEEEAEAKLREAKSEGDDPNGEVEQQKREDLKERSDEIIAGSRPATEWPTGILSIRIEQINGLEVQRIRESGVRDEGQDDHSDDLPSAYCTIIINHQQVYKTRTKMKTNNPFYDAGTENFVRDWRNALVLIAVRDSRLHETDPLLGVIMLPLRETLRHRSQITNSLPLVGGIGYGRVKFALSFRSVQTKLSKCLLGWDLVTLEIQPSVKSSIDLPADISLSRLVFHTAHEKGKMIPNSDGGWKQKAGRPIRLAISKRYASCLLVQLRKHAVGREVTPAFCTLWLKDLPDDEEVSVSLPVWKNEGHSLEQARTNAKASHGEQLGTLDLRLRIWPGLSGYHHTLADHDRNMADVMDALDGAEESKDMSHEHLYEETHSEDSDSSSDSEHEEQEMGEDGHHTVGAVQGAQKYRRHEKTLHRKHRGLMQWSAARNVAWIGRGFEHKANKLGDKIAGTFKHQTRENGIAKEA